MIASFRSKQRLARMSNIIEIVLKAKDLPVAARKELDIGPETECQVKITVIEPSTLNKRLRILEEIRETSRKLDAPDLTDIVRQNREDMNQRNRTGK